MSSIHALTVVLDEDYREDAEVLAEIESAIRMIRGVAGTHRHDFDHNVWTPRVRLRTRVGQDLHQAIIDILDGKGHRPAD